LKNRILMGLASFAFACSQPSSGSEMETTKPKAADKQRAVRVETAVLESTTATVDLVLSGEVEAFKDSELASATGGYVERVHKKKGEHIKAGESIAWIDRSVHAAAFEQAAAELERAEAELARAERAGSAMSRARREAAEFSARSARAAHKLAQIRRRSSLIVAPFDGTLANVDVTEGEVVSPGGRVARLIQTDPVLINVTASDRDVVSLTPDMPARISTPARSGDFEGKISSVSPAADLDTRSFEVEIEVPNPEGLLLPGMIASARVAVSLPEKSLTVPQYVLVTKRDGNGVFIVEGNVVRWRTVELGRVVRDQVVVRSGLAAEENIVVTGHRELADGDRIIVSREGRCCTDGRVVFGSEAGN